MSREVSIGARVRAQAKSTPDRVAIAVVDGSGLDMTVTWAELEARSDDVAYALVGRGVRASDAVAVAIEDGVGHAIATLGAWKLGATVVPVPTQAAGRGTAYDVTSFAAVLTAADLEGVPPRSEREPFGPLAAAPRSASFTGGTTGDPKLIPRRMPWSFDPDSCPTEHQKWTGWRWYQRQLVVLSLYHGGFTAMYTGLFLGHLIVHIPKFTPERFFDAVERWQPQLMRTVPALMRTVAESGADPTSLGCFDTVLHGSAPLLEPVRRWWFAAVGPERLFESYGAQDQVGVTTVRGDEWLNRPGTVGRPADGCKAEIRDERGEPLPPGTVGLVYMWTPLAADGAPTFRTVGDLGWMDEDGFLYLEGRREDIVNVGGASVRPLEVESVLRSLPGLADVAVFAVDDATLGQCVGAAVVLAEGETLSPSVVRSHCRKRLPLTHVPTTVVFVTSLPVTPIGKVDRRALAAQVANRGTLVAAETSHP